MALMALTARGTASKSSRTQMHADFRRWKEGSAGGHYNEWGNKRMKRRIVAPGTRCVYLTSWIPWKQD